MGDAWQQMPNEMKFIYKELARKMRETPIADCDAMSISGIQRYRDMLNVPFDTVMSYVEMYISHN